MGVVHRGKDGLSVRYRNASGTWVTKATKFKRSLGEESKAQRLHDQIVARIVAQQPNAEADLGAMTMGRWSEEFFRKREARGLSSHDDDVSRYEHHIKPAFERTALESIRPEDVQAFVRALKVKPRQPRTKAERAGEVPVTDLLAPRMVRHIYFLLKLLLERAYSAGHIGSNPCVLEEGDLPKKRDKDPTWRQGAVFNAREVEQLISDTRIPEDRRLLYGLNFLSGSRPGEISALTWRHYDTDLEPLGRLTVAIAYDRDRKKLKGTKTETPRLVPVHPTLAKLLASWKVGGWQRLMGRAPGLDDLIIPSRASTQRKWRQLGADGKTRALPRKNRKALERFHQDLEQLGMRKRRAYDSRRTFISLLRAAGVSKDVIKWLTHPPEDQVDDYTTLPWETLCAAVLKLRVKQLAGDVVAMANHADQQEVPEEGAGTSSHASSRDISTRKKAPGFSNLEPQKWRGVRDSNMCPPAPEAPSGGSEDARFREVAQRLAALSGAGSGKTDQRVVTSRDERRRRGGIGGRPRKLAVEVRIVRGRR